MCAHRANIFVAFIIHESNDFEMNDISQVYSYDRMKQHTRHVFHQNSFIYNIIIRFICSTPAFREMSPINFVTYNVIILIMAPTTMTTKAEMGKLISYFRQKRQEMREPNFSNLIHKCQNVHYVHDSCKQRNKRSS